MKYRKISAIIRTDRLRQVEEGLREIGVPGMSITRVKGYGECADFYSTDWCVTHARVEIFIHESQVDEIVQAIMESARTGIEGDGIVSVSPVEHLYHIRNGEEAVGLCS